MAHKAKRQRGSLNEKLALRGKKLFNAADAEEAQRI
jgi:hypothetical protein